jgi:UDP-glucose:(glucosyl)LPS alpha-1,2-glucosyltransferase
MPFAKDKYSGNAMGGTEIMKVKLGQALPESLLDNFQIFVSRVHEELSDKHVRVLWLQDLAGDPESNHLANGGWAKFHKLVFSSYWQMRGFVEMYNIPWSKCIVIRNGIKPIDFETKDRSTIKLVYTPTPHRGLNILYPVFDKLSKEYDNIELDVYSSFKLYGWDERDKPFEKLFEDLKAHPKINYHGTVPNDQLRDELAKAHIFAYPSIWQETSCICLMEAMSAGLICVHSSLGALPETSANWSNMYPFNENMQDHANMFYSVLKGTIEDVKNMDEDSYMSKIRAAKAYTDVFHNWDFIKMQWESLLQSLVNEPRAIAKTQGPMFEYRV